jgi:hypothetical protein
MKTTFISLLAFLLIVTAEGQVVKVDSAKADVKNVKLNLIKKAAEAAAAALEDEGFPKSQTSEYTATVLNTNFTVPIIRFNRVENDPNKKGDVAFFNSVGAGIGINAGRLLITADEHGKAINHEMNNTFGVQGGFLFAANTKADATNIFALTLSFSVLNFQVGYGYDFGSVPSEQKRGFYTISYGIPFSKFINGGFYVLKRSLNPVNSKDTSGFIN